MCLPSGIRLFFTLAFLLCSWINAEADEPLRLAVHPYLGASELVDRFTPLTEYLEEHLDRKISLEISRNYQEHIKKIGQDRVEIAYLGPASYVKMVATYGGKKILARLETGGTPTFQGFIIVCRDSSIKELTDLKGKRFAFGDPNSTMSHLVPRYMLEKAGITLKDLSGYSFINNHHNVALGVLMDHFDAGAVKEEVFYEYKEKGLQPLARTPPISEHLFVASSKLPQETFKALQQHLFDLEESPHGRKILKAIKQSVTGLSPASEADYRNLRTILQELGPIRTEAE